MRITLRKGRAIHHMSRAAKIISISVIVLFFVLASVSGAAQIYKRGLKVIDGKAAYVQEAASLKDYVLYSAFGASGTDKVIAGNDGWLFFAETLNDFTGAKALSDEEIRIIAAKVRQLSDYCEENGAKFCFVIAPNKNTIYPEHMPKYYKSANEKGNTNFDRLIDSLDELGVDSPDARKLFTAQSGETFYYKTDTHWNAKGAAVIADCIIESCSAENGFRYAYHTPEASDFTGGDLYKLLFPSAIIKERDVSGLSDISYNYAPASGYRYTEPPVSMMDLEIETQCDGAEGGKLLVYRDSFGSELVPLLSSQFSSVRYLRGNMPYDFSYIKSDRPEAVVFVIAERNIPSLLTAAFGLD